VAQDVRRGETGGRHRKVRRRRTGSISASLSYATRAAYMLCVCHVASYRAASCDIFSRSRITAPHGTVALDMVGCFCLFVIRWRRRVISSLNAAPAYRCRTSRVTTTLLPCLARTAIAYAPRAVPFVPRVRQDWQRRRHFFATIAAVALPAFPLLCLCLLFVRPQRMRARCCTLLPAASARATCAATALATAHAAAQKAGLSAAHAGLSCALSFSHFFAHFHRCHHSEAP